ncbi:TrmH family RNA methyltransferase [Maribellus sediminis]|uniref:TrmH family RNA methyltransferase n=1 Tax=Maribellus sediminis TaxID=2696285 RepID=UPI001430CF29|nr:TrmH family RNA methyltransferase [Maribellus sediminis]
MNTNSIQFFNTNPVDVPGGAAEIILAAWQISNSENIGKIIRLAHNVGASQALFIQGGENHRLSKIKKTAGFSFDQQNWSFCSEEEFLSNYLPYYDSAALETCDGATNIFTTQLPKKILLLAGSESHGIPEHILDKINHKVVIPMPGGCKSMNVSNALSVAAFEWLRQTNYSL